VPPSSSNPLQHLSFYRFVRVDDPARLAEWLREVTRSLNGSILLAEEGINGMVAGPAGLLGDFVAAMSSHPLFAGMAFKRSDCATAPFGRMTVHVRREVLPLGVEGVDAVGRPGTQVAPADWRALLADPELVLIDNRSRFEHRLGRYRGAIDPQVDNFRDLPRFIAEHAPAWKAEGRRVAMYCTGGIRCEKTAAWMEDAFGLDVLQLEGGILNHFAQVPDAHLDFDGECFVFDNRIALDTRLQESPTTAADVYGDAPDEAWRLQRALRLARST
jgi:UPF0176 protein